MSKIQQGKMLRNVRESLINPETGEYYTQAEFGSEINLTRETVSKWENKAEIPEKLVKLVKTVFNANPDYIREGKEPMFKVAPVHSAISITAAEEASAFSPMFIFPRAIC